MFVVTLHPALLLKFKGVKILDKRILLKNEVRTCIICQEEKNLVLGFHFHPFNNSFCRTCKRCISDKKKIEYKEKSTYDKNIKGLKVCKICGEEKETNGGFYFHKKQGFRDVCKECSNKKKRATWENKQKNEEKIRSFREYTIEDRARCIIRTYSKVDKNKGLDFNLSLEFVINQLKKSCIYCGFESEGLDRKDNNIGHIESNCEPSCTSCNMVRMNKFSFEEMKEIGKSLKKIKKLRISKN